jgi:hypothetical protein
MAEKELIIDDDLIPLYGDFIIIPPKRLFWRGYDTTFSIVSDRPAYYSSKEIASGYVRTGKDVLSPFMNTRPLRLLDIRYLKVILQQLLDDIKINKEYTPNTAKNEADNTNIIFLTASFGLCSLPHQIDLLKYIFFNSIQGHNRKNKIEKIIENEENMKGLKNLITYSNEETYPIVEQRGFRIGETQIDADTMYFLQHFFSGFADGFISPRLISPYHIEKEGTMSPEMIIFNPLASGIEIATLTKQKLETELVSYLIMKNKKQILLESGNFKTKIYTQNGNIQNNNKKGGNCSTKEHYLNTLERKIIEKDPQILTLCHNGIQCAKRWEKNYVKLYQTEPPVPSTPISIFQNKTYTPTPKKKPL